MATDDDSPSLPRYAETTLCRQCGVAVTAARFAGETGYACRSHGCTEYIGGHMHRECPRCGYRWAEALTAPTTTNGGGET